MTTTTIERPSITTRSGVGPIGSALLVLAPLLMALARVLLVPLDSDDWNRTLTEMAAHQSRSDLGWLLAIPASGLLGITAAVLGGQLYHQRARTATFVIVSTAIGWAATAGVAAQAHLMSEMSKTTDRDAQVRILAEFNDNASTGLVFLLAVIAAVGYIALAVGLARTGLTSKGAALLIGLGGATTLLTMAGPVTPLLVATALVLASGHGLALRSLSGDT